MNMQKTDEKKPAEVAGSDESTSLAGYLRAAKAWREAVAERMGYHAKMRQDVLGKTQALRLAAANIPPEQAPVAEAIGTLADALDLFVQADDLDCRNYIRCVHPS